MKNFYQEISHSEITEKLKNLQLLRVRNHKIGPGEITVFSRSRQSCSKWPKPFTGKRQLAKAAKRAKQNV